MSAWFGLIPLLLATEPLDGALSERLDRVCLRAMMSPQPGHKPADAGEQKWFVIASNGTENPYAGCARAFAAVRDTAPETNT